jgi:hypothetical protein
MQTRMLYHADAVGASGNLTLPVQESMPIQASVSLPLIGGHGAAEVKEFRYRNILYFSWAESTVVGSYSEKDKAHGSASMAIIEDLNIMDVVTCDRIVARVTTKHAGDEPSIIPMGSLFENLRIAGNKIEPDLAIDTFTQHETWEKLNAAHGNAKTREQLNKQSFHKEGKKLPTSKGMFGCTLVRDFGKLPVGLEERNGGIYVPHFGTVYLGEFYVTQYSRRLLMLHVDLGCSTEGCFGAGGTGGNGTPFP